MKQYQFVSEILPSSRKGGAYVIFPYDVREEFGKGRVKVQVLFETIPYQGSIVNMGLKNEDRSTCYVIGMLKSIRQALNKEIGDSVSVIVSEILDEKEIKEDDPTTESKREKRNSPSSKKSTTKDKKDSSEHRIYSTAFSDVYPIYLDKVVKKSRTKEELDEVIVWLTGYDAKDLHKVLEQRKSFREFFDQAPKINEKADLITGTICGVKIQEIEDPLMKKIRYLDKLVDELAKGRPMKKILRD